MTNLFRPFDGEIVEVYLSKLPVVSEKRIWKALQKIGYYINHHKGSHIILKKYLFVLSRMKIKKFKRSLRLSMIICVKNIHRKFGNI